MDGKFKSGKTQTAVVPPRFEDDMNEDMNLQSMPNQGDNSSFKVAEYLTAATEAAANNHKRLARAYWHAPRMADCC